MLAGVKAGDFMLQPGDHRFRDEAAKFFIAGVVLLAGLHIDMINEGERHVRQSATVEHGLENRNSFHLAPVKFAVEKEAEAMRLADRAAQQMNGPGEAGDDIGDIMFFEFDGYMFRFLAGQSRRGREI